jgi:hypothetical protein
MNKTLFVKVKDLCKDTGLSEKYLKVITEKIGGSIEDDSTDETAIGNMANQIADIAKETQGEATRWASKKKDDPSKDDDSKKDDDPKKKDDSKKDPNAKKIEDMEKELENMKKEQAAKEHENAVTKALDRHGIPAWRRKGLVIPENEDPDKYCAALKQDLITENLLPEDPESVKTVSEKNVDEASDSLLESIIVK